LPTSKDLPSSLVQLRIAVWTGVTRDTRPSADIWRNGKLTFLEPDRVVPKGICLSVALQPRARNR
jgi:hypothetical protein